MTPEPFTVRDSTNLEAAARILLRLKVAYFTKLWFKVCGGGKPDICGGILMDVLALYRGPSTHPAGPC